MWDVEIVSLVRMLIDDLDGASYDDCRMAELVLLSAHMTLVELDLNDTYTVDITNQTISPDPTESPKNPAVTNLIALKTAYFILKNEYKAASKLGIRIMDGPATVDLTGKLAGMQKSVEDIFGRYEKAKLDYRAGNCKSGESVMTPFTTEQVPIQDNFR